MFTKRIIPCLDVNNGRVVKGINFVNLRDAGDPVEIAAAYDKAGADEVVFLDITASSDNRNTVVDMVRKLMDWNAEDNWNVPGIYFAEEQGIMYALESAYAPRAKGGWAARREREAAAALAESSIDSEEVNY